MLTTGLMQQATPTLVLRATVVGWGQPTHDHEIWWWQKPRGVGLQETASAQLSALLQEAHAQAGGQVSRLRSEEASCACSSCPTWRPPPTRVTSRTSSSAQPASAAWRPPAGSAMQPCTQQLPYQVLCCRTGAVDGPLRLPVRVIIVDGALPSLTLQRNRTAAAERCAHAYQVVGFEMTGWRMDWFCQDP